jgi:hypothetical protein
MGDVLHRSRGRVPRAEFFCAPLALAALFLCLAAPAAADYRNPRVLGDRYWEPPSLRTTESMASLHPTRSTGRLKGLEGRVREEGEVDADRGLVYIRQRVGDAWIEPEWIADFGTAARAQEMRPSARRGRTPSEEGQEQTGKEGDVVSIELPVASRNRCRA